MFLSILSYSSLCISHNYAKLALWHPIVSQEYILYLARSLELRVSNMRGGIHSFWGRFPRNAPILGGKQLRNTYYAVLKIGILANKLAMKCDLHSDIWIGFTCLHTSDWSGSCPEEGRL